MAGNVEVCWIKSVDINRSDSPYVDGFQHKWHQIRGGDNHGGLCQLEEMFEFEELVGRVRSDINSTGPDDRKKQSRVEVL